MRRILVAMAVGVSIAPACGDRTLPPKGEIILYFDTDAPLPPAPGTSVDLVHAPSPLFDRLKVEVYEPAATVPCQGCSREFAVDAQRAQSLALSVGVPLPAGRAGYRARVRLFRGGSTKNEPAGQSTIEIVALLPPTAADGLVERSVMLLTETVGKPVGTLAAPVETAPGAPTSSRVGTWAGAHRRSCASDPGPGEACVPGGAFWMGNALGTPRDRGDGADRERLVALSPYFLDRAEVTAGQFRAFRASDPSVIAWSGATSGMNEADFCSFTAEPSNRDNLPMNCVPWDAARAFCLARGADLPTEAQFEFPAGGLDARPFVWGRDEPTCDGAVWGSSGYGFYEGVASPCKAPVTPGGPSSAGKGTLDRLMLPTGTITELAGNVSEWALDEWNRQDEACWSHGGVYTDPLCATASAIDVPGRRSHRGGNWILLGPDLQASARNADVPSDTNVALGFRCARKGAP